MNCSPALRSHRPAHFALALVLTAAPQSSQTVVEYLDRDSVPGVTLQVFEDLAIDGDGSIYTVDVFERFVRVRPDGVAEELFDLPNDITSVGEFEIDAAGNIYGSLPWEDQVFKRAPDGTVSTVMGPAGDGSAVRGTCGSVRLARCT